MEGEERETSSEQHLSFKSSFITIHFDLTLRYLSKDHDFNSHSKYLSYPAKYVLTTLRVVESFRGGGGKGISLQSHKLLFW